MDLLGGPVRRSAGRGGVPPLRAEGGGREGFELLQEQQWQVRAPSDQLLSVQ